MGDGEEYDYCDDEPDWFESVEANEEEWAENHYYDSVLDLPGDHPAFDVDESINNGRDNDYEYRARESATGCMILLLLPVVVFLFYKYSIPLGI
jgi:hypothetical protein